MELKIGAKAPEFSLPNQDGIKTSLKDFKGSWVLLYFYPKDDTPGCTVEACTIRDAYPDFQNCGAVVLGMSADTEKKHSLFANKYGLPFTLLSDPDHTTLEKYGVWQEKSMMGRKYMGIVRSSVLINPEGKIAKLYETVKPALHAAEVLADIQNLSR